MTSRGDNRFYREPQTADQELRYDEDGLHIYWFDPVEGCWVAFRRVDCVGEEELPEQRLPRFEQAHTPTDDEQEALANLIPLDLVHDRARPGFPQNTFEVADRIFAAGFTRRPMPSREEVAKAIARGLDGWNDFDNASADYQNELLSGADAVLALFATPGGDS